MARLRDENASQFGIFLYALLLLATIILTSAVYLPPAALVMALIYFEFRASRTSRKFDLDEEERRELAEIEAHLRSIWHRLSNIDCEGHHLKKNLDGTYHRGSRLGMQLNDELRELRSQEGSSERRAYGLREGPLQTLIVWMAITSQRNAFRWTLPFYFLVGLITYIVHPTSISRFTQIIGQHVLLRISGVNDAVYGCALIAAFASLLFFPIAYAAHLYWLKRSMKEIRTQAQTLAEDRPLYLDDQEQYDDDDCENKEDEDQTPIDGDDQPRPWFIVLGVRPGASRNEIKTARDSLARIYHSDRLRNERPHVVDVADKRLAEVNLAYEQAFKHRKTR